MRNCESHRFRLDKYKAKRWIFPQIFAKHFSQTHFGKPIESSKAKWLINTFHEASINVFRSPTKIDLYFDKIRLTIFASARCLTHVNSFPSLAPGNISMSHKQATFSRMRKDRLRNIFSRQASDSVEFYCQKKICIFPILTRKIFFHRFFFIDICFFRRSVIWRRSPPENASSLACLCIHVVFHITSSNKRMWRRKKNKNRVEALFFLLLSAPNYKIIADRWKYFCFRLTFERFRHLRRGGLVYETVVFISFFWRIESKSDRVVWERLRNSVDFFLESCARNSWFSLADTI